MCRRCAAVQQARTEVTRGRVLDTVCKLLARDATDGVIEDLGAFHSIWFTDPDGMRVEVVHITNDLLDGIHAPRPIEPAA